MQNAFAYLYYGNGRKVITTSNTSEYLNNFDGVAQLWALCQNDQATMNALNADYGTSGSGGYPADGQMNALCKAIDTVNSQGITDPNSAAQVAANELNNGGASPGNEIAVNTNTTSYGTMPRAADLTDQQKQQNENDITQDFLNNDNVTWYIYYLSPLLGATPAEVIHSLAWDYDYDKNEVETAAYLYQYIVYNLSYAGDGSSYTNQYPTLNFVSRFAQVDGGPLAVQGRLTAGGFAIITEFSKPVVNGQTMSLSYPEANQNVLSMMLLIEYINLPDFNALFGTQLSSTGTISVADQQIMFNFLYSFGQHKVYDLDSSGNPNSQLSTDAANMPAEAQIAAAYNDTEDYPYLKAYINALVGTLGADAPTVICALVTEDNQTLDEINNSAQIFNAIVSNNDLTVFINKYSELNGTSFTAGGQLTSQGFQVLQGIAGQSSGKTTTQIIQDLNSIMLLYNNFGTQDKVATDNLYPSDFESNGSISSSDRSVLYAILDLPGSSHRVFVTSADTATTIEDLNTANSIWVRGATTDYNDGGNFFLAIFGEYGTCGYNPDDTTRQNLFVVINCGYRTVIKTSAELDTFMGYMQAVKVLWEALYYWGWDNSNLSTLNELFGCTSILGGAYPSYGELDAMFKGVETIDALAPGQMDPETLAQTFENYLPLAATFWGDMKADGAIPAFNQFFGTTGNGSSPSQSQLLEIFKLEQEGVITDSSSAQALSQNLNTIQEIENEYNDPADYPGVQQYINALIGTFGADVPTVINTLVTQYNQTPDEINNSAQIFNAIVSSNDLTTFVNKFSELNGQPFVDGNGKLTYWGEIYLSQLSNPCDSNGHPLNATSQQIMQNLDSIVLLYENVEPC